jgi:ribosome-binding factor A
MKTHRLARVAEAIREVASETILYELRDPRVKMVTVTRAEVSGDLQHAKVHVSIMGTEKEQQLTLRGLKHAAGFVQSKLARRLQTRFTPVLTFVLDQGVKHSIEMTRLIKEALAQGAPPAEEAPQPEAADGSAEEVRDQRSEVGDQGPTNL